MIDSLNLDQLRVFMAIVEQGSFSAAARHLRRAQSAVSNAVSNLESSLGVTLFDRSGWKPQLTAHGQALLADARAVLERVDQLKSRAQRLTEGMETELSVVLDVMFPMQKLVELAARFRQTFPGVALRLYIDALGGVPQRVISGECGLGVQGSLPDIAPELLAHALPEIAMVPVAAPGHVLAGQHDVSDEQLRDQTQIVLIDRSAGTEGRSFSVYSEQQTLTSDLGAKRALLCAGLGWGFMPRSFVEEDLRTEQLVELNLTQWPRQQQSITLHAVHKRNTPLGPAGQWVLEMLLECSGNGA